MLSVVVLGTRVVRKVETYTKVTGGSDTMTWLSGPWKNKPVPRSLQVDPTLGRVGGSHKDDEDKLVNTHRNNAGLKQVTVSMFYKAGNVFGHTH